eukprot:1540593-Prymnesium_polylepis.1
MVLDAPPALESACAALRTSSACVALWIPSRPSSKLIVISGTVERTDCSAVLASITHGVEHGEGGAESTARSTCSRARWAASSKAAPDAGGGFAFRLREVPSEEYVHAVSPVWPRVADGRCCGRWPMLSPKA